MLFRTKKRQKPPPPPWLKWVFIGFIIFAFISNMQKDKPGAPNMVHRSINEATAKLNPKNLIDYTSYTQKLFPNMTSLRIKDEEIGKGNPAVCGQRVRIAYEVFLTDGTAIKDGATAEKPLEFRIGDGKVMPVLEQGVVGMKIGGKRSLLAPPNLSYGLDAFKRGDVPELASTRMEVTLLDSTPALPDTETSPYRIFNAGGTGSPAAISCGQPAKLHIVIWDLAGKKLYSTQDKGEPITFTPGRSEVFLGLEQGAVGLQYGSGRNLIVPPDFQKTMDGNAPTLDFPLPAHQTVLVDIVAVP